MVILRHTAEPLSGRRPSRQYVSIRPAWYATVPPEFRDREGKLGASFAYFLIESGIPVDARLQTGTMLMYQ